MKRFISLVLALTFVLSSALFFTLSAKTGKRFTVSDKYQTLSAVDTTPRTFEAWIKVDKNASSDRLGIIVGNFGASADKSSINFEIRTNGNPYLWWNVGNGGAASIAEFSNVDLRTGEKLHLAITTSATTASCYINGELKQTLSRSMPSIEKAKLNNFAVGGDFRSGNTMYLRSTELYSTSVFSNTRDASQIKNDMNSLDTQSSELLFAYDLSVSGKERLRDLSKNANHLVYTNTADPSKNESYIGENAPKEGLYFTASDIYRTPEALDKVPLTFVAEIWFPTTFSKSERGGVIVGNYGGAKRSINFEIYTGGAPRIYWVDSQGSVRDIVFSNVNVYNGKWTTVAVTIDTVDAKCYVDGALKQSIMIEPVSKEACTTPFVIGGDLRPSNDRYFKGKLGKLFLGSKVLNASEIASGEYSKGAIALLDKVTDASEERPLVLKDKSGKGNDVKLYRSWIDSYEMPNDFAYSFAIVGDTQIVAESYPDKFADIYDWIKENKQSHKIQFVMGLGDITNSNTFAEWSLAKTNIAKLDGILGYSLCRGNHDGSAQFNSAFSSGKYPTYLKGSYGGKLENTWQELVVGETEYLIMTLDYGASDEVLAWAGNVISSHPEHNVIITTHAYLFRDGTTLDQSDVCPPATTGGHNNGDHMWDKLISKYENITLVLSGHDPCDRVVTTQTKGRNGNVVTQMLIDPQGVDSAQGATGMVAMLYFSADGRDVQVRYYSTVRDKYYMDDNQFSMVINAIGTDIHTSGEPDTDLNDVTGDPDGEKKNGTDSRADLTIALSVTAVIVAVGAVAVVMTVKKKKKRANG